ncbi:MAG TPA: hypothetical protein VH144_02135 [Candidatus Saccharimonadales bacterium]|jgi:hypothetical protein|nr:hypothetical protein [Candidatus Saccharimonadales bacterium]
MERTELFTALSQESETGIIETREYKRRLIESGMVKTVDAAIASIHTDIEDGHIALTERWQLKLAEVQE